MVLLQNIQERLYQHKSKLQKGHTKKYNLHKLVYFEKYDTIVYAIKREKQLKNWQRNWKIELVKKYNPNLHDLFKLIFYEDTRFIMIENDYKDMHYQIPCDIQRKCDSVS